MTTTEIKKALYKEKPIAKRTGYKSGQFTRNVTHAVYSAETSLGIHKFEVSNEDIYQGNFEENMPAQLLIRWLINEDKPAKINNHD